MYRSPVEVRLAKKVTSQNGHNRLEEAIALLIQNEAALAARLVESDKRHAESDQRHAENERLHLEYERRWLELKQQSDERFARVEKDIASIIQVLNEHTRILERLPDALREKIGFKALQ
jgi:predicted  nucleic acid-binding Zn-ribbon protein